MTMYTDPIHGQFELPEIIKAIIETPMFRRLKEIKQLGCTSYYFSNANHTRYAHCIGTYYLAKKMLQQLSVKQKYEIPVFYEKCVWIAALLHDIGHGPFSHYWEHICDELGYEFIHEENCRDAVSIIFNEIEHVQKLSDDNERHHFGIELIKSFIIGNDENLQEKIEEQYKFLYDIVNNKQCGIDVDKWDYLLRDEYYGRDYLKGDLNKFNEVFENARISKDKLHIEYNRDNYNEIYNLFENRFKLHVQLYQEPNVLIKEYILTEAIKLFVEKGYRSDRFNGRTFFRITSKDKEFLKLTDNNVLDMLRDVNNEEINNYLSFLENKVFTGVENQIPFKIKIENPGEKMQEDKIPFYGKCVRDKIEPVKGFYIKTYYFYK